MEKKVYNFASLARFLPFLNWWPLVNGQTAKSDILAGLTGAIIVLPQGVAFATIAGLPPEYGLYSAMLPAIIAALFGSSWHLVSGPTTAISIVVFSTISPLADPGSAQFITLALTLTILVGVIQLIMGVARLGVLVNFISHSVVIGFTAGAAILIASSQIKNFFGIQIAQGSSFYEIIIALFEQLGNLNPYVTVVGVITLASGIIAKKYFPKFPYMIVAMLIGSISAFFLNLFLDQTMTGIRTVGALPATLPPLSLPDFSLSTLQQMAPNAFAVSILALTEAVSISRAIAVRSHQRIDGNQEFIGQGLSNIFGSFFSCYASSGSFNRSGLNYEAGAKTPMASIFASIVLVLVLLLVAPLAAYLPVAAMAGILFLVAWGLIDFHHIKGILKASRSESSVLVTTFLSTLFLELEFAIYVGVILSLVLYLKRTSKPKIVNRVPDPSKENRAFVTDNTLPQCPQLKIVRIDGSLFFGAVNHVQETLQNMEEKDPEQRHLLIVSSGINFVDVAGAEMLAQEAKRKRALGGAVYLYDVKGDVCKILKQGGYIDEIGEERIFRSKTQALQTIFNQLDHERCSRCDKRIFRECQQIPMKIGQDESSNIIKLEKSGEYKASKA